MAILKFMLHLKNWSALSKRNIPAVYDVMANPINRIWYIKSIIRVNRKHPLAAEFPNRKFAANVEKLVIKSPIAVTIKSNALFVNV